MCVLDVYNVCLSVCSYVCVGCVLVCLSVCSYVCAGCVLVCLFVCSYVCVTNSVS